jgi:hypothetical protein
MPPNQEDHQAESGGIYENVPTGSAERLPSPAFLALERAIRDVKTPPPARRLVLVAGQPAQVTVTSVLRKFADLREAVSVYSRYLRDEGVPPERMLPQVKIAVCDVIASEGWKDRTVEQLVLENVVRWAIDAYYAD